MEDIKDIRSLINLAIKINIRIYQREKASKGSNITIPVHRTPQ